MTYITRALALIFLTFLGQSAAASDCIVPENANVLASEIAAGVNATRRANGESTIRFNRRLGRAATAHACDMMQNAFFDHEGTDGSNSVIRVESAGYRQCLVGENLAWGYPESARIISEWMHSAGHRAIMLHPRVEEFGVGISQGENGPYWVLVVAKRC
jgi:uncharacterized protein YkwD